MLFDIAVSLHKSGLDPFRLGRRRGAQGFQLLVLFLLFLVIGGLELQKFVLRLRRAHVYIVGLALAVVGVVVYFLYMEGVGPGAGANSMQFLEF